MKYFFSSEQKKKTESGQKELKCQSSTVLSSKTAICIKCLCKSILRMQSRELKVESKMFFSRLFSGLVQMGA